MTGRTRLGLLVAGGVALLSATLVMMRDQGPGAATTAAPSPGSARAGAPGGDPVTGLRLERLSQMPPAPPDVRRNPFRFRAAVARQSAPLAAAPRAAPASRIADASGPPTVQSIPLRYIGLVNAPSQAGRVGIFSDGRGNVFQAREGDIIEGRYSVAQIGADSAELSHIDGRGRQTIRLSGQ